VGNAPILFISDDMDPEAAAASRLLKMMIQEMIQTQVALDLTLDNEAYLALLHGAAAVSTCCILTSGSLTAERQLARLAVFFQVHPQNCVFPVLIGETFCFPSETYYDDLERKGGSWASADAATEAFSCACGVPVTPGQVKGALIQLFQSIANFVNVPYANEASLCVQVKTLVGKVRPQTDTDSSTTRSQVACRQAATTAPVPMRSLSIV
jgi:hypothetical protein